MVSLQIVPGQILRMNTQLSSRALQTTIWFTVPEEIHLPSLCSSREDESETIGMELHIEISSHLLTFPWKSENDDDG